MNSLDEGYAAASHRAPQSSANLPESINAAGDDRVPSPRLFVMPRAPRLRPLPDPPIEEISPAESKRQKILNQ